MNTKTRISQLFFDARLSRKLTLREFASTLQVNFQAVHQWERSERSPSAATLMRLMGNSEQWVSDLAFRCLLIRYPFINKILAMRSRRIGDNQPKAQAQ